EKAAMQSISPEASASEHTLAYSLPLRESGRETMSEQGKYLEELHLPPDTSQYSYSGFQQLQQAVDQADERFRHHNRSPIVVFANLAPEEFQRCKDDLPGRVDYHCSLQLLIITMVSSPHEIAAEGFNELMRHKANERQVRRALVSKGSTRTDERDRKKEADKSWAPSRRNLPPERNTKWPSVAMEVAYSESRAKVKSDME